MSVKLSHILKLKQEDGSTVELQLWHIGSAFIGLISIILGVYARINMIWVVPAKAREEERKKERQEEREKFLVWKTSTESRVAQLEHVDTEFKALLDVINVGIQELKTEQASQHSDMRDLLHAEISRLEEKMSARNGEIFAKIDQIKLHAG